MWSTERENHRSIRSAAGALPALRRLRQDVGLTRV